MNQILTKAAFQILLCKYRQLTMVTSQVAILQTQPSSQSKVNSSANSSWLLVTTVITKPPGHIKGKHVQYAQKIRLQ